MLNSIGDNGSHLGFGTTPKINNTSQREHFWQVASDF